MGPIKRLLRVFLAAFLLGSHCAPELARATDFYVDAAAGSDANACLAAGAGNACKRITKALALAAAAASPPHTIHIAAGKYDDVVNGEVFPLAPTDGVSLVADYGVSLTTISQVSNSTATILYNRSMTMPSDTVLDGFTIVNNNAGAGADGVVLAPQAPGAVVSPVIRNNIFLTPFTNSIKANGTFATATVSPRIANNTITSPGASGIYFFADAGTLSPTITGNAVASSGLNGIYVRGAGPATASPTISNNTVSGSAGMGIVIYGHGTGITSAASISANTVRDSGGVSVFSWGGGGINVWMGNSPDVNTVDIDGNLVSGCTGYPIGLGDSGAGASPIIRNNTVTDNRGVFSLYVYTNGASAARISSNTVVGNAGDGISLAPADTSAPRVARNTVIGNGGFGIDMTAYAGITAANLASNSVIANGASGLRMQGGFGTTALPVISSNWFSGNGSPEISINTGGEISPRFSSNTVLASGTSVAMTLVGNVKIDLGGGALGSVGHNTIKGAGGAYDLDSSADNNALIANYNWWTTAVPLMFNPGVGGVAVSTQNAPFLSFSVDPASGSVAGGTTVTITADDANVAFVDYVGSTGTRITVTIGGVSASSIRVNAAGTRITAVTPSGTAGEQSLFVRNPAGQNGTGTSTRGFTFIAAPAAAPSGLAGAAQGVSSVTWTWSAASGATSYRFYPSTGGPPIDLAAATLTQTDLSSNTLYGARVSAVTAGGEGPLTSAASVYTQAGPAAVAADGATIILNSAAGPAAVHIPPGAFSSAVSVTLRAPSSFPSGAGDLTGTGIGLEILLDQTVQPILPVPLSVTFRDSDAAGMNKSTLLLARYDSDRNVWTPLLSSVDTVNNVVAARTRHFSIFQIMASVPASGLDKVRVIPNPFRPNQGHAAMGFFNLPPFSRVRIYTYAGALIKDISANGAGLAVWDGTNSVGAKAVSGGYYALVQGAGQSRSILVAIQR